MGSAVDAALSLTHNWDCEGIFGIVSAGLAPTSVVAFNTDTVHSRITLQLINTTSVASPTRAIFRIWVCAASFLKRRELQRRNSPLFSFYQLFLLQEAELDEWMWIQERFI